MSMAKDLKEQERGDNILVAGIAGGVTLAIV
jgi:hypothetical protein